MNCILHAKWFLELFMCISIEIRKFKYLNYFIIEFKTKLLSVNFLMHNKFKFIMTIIHFMKLKFSYICTAHYLCTHYIYNMFSRWQ